MNGSAACGNATHSKALQQGPVMSCIRYSRSHSRCCSSAARGPPAFRWGAPAVCQHQVLPATRTQIIGRAAGQACTHPTTGEQPVLPEYIIDVDAVLDVSEVLYHLAWHAAHALWPAIIVGSPQLFHKPLAAVMPALQKPHEAVVAVRLFVEEGIVGARSTAGRAGPVVGRSVRWGGSRPLNPVEIREDWPTVLTTCLIKWSRNPGDPAPPQPQQLMGHIQQAYDQVLAEQGALQVWSEQQQQQQQPVVVAVRQGPAANAQSQLGLASSSSSSSSSSRVRMTQASAGSDLPLVRPYAAAGQAVARCSQPLWLASAHPATLNQALSAAALEVGATGRIVAWEELVTMSLPPPDDQAQQPPTQQLGLQQQLQQLLDGQDEVASSASSRAPGTHVVVSTPARLKQWRKAFTLAQQQQQQQLSEQQQRQQPGHGQVPAAAGHQVPQLAWHVSDWTCGDAAVQAQVLAAGGAELLSEAGLAELLGLGDVDVIMDGVAWRG